MASISGAGSSAGSSAQRRPETPNQLTPTDRKVLSLIARMHMCGSGENARAARDSLREQAASLFYPAQPESRKGGGQIDLERAELFREVEGMLECLQCYGDQELIEALCRGVNLDEPFSVQSIAQTGRIKGTPLNQLFLQAKREAKWGAAFGLIQSGRISPGFITQLFIESCRNKNFIVLRSLSVIKNIFIPSSAFDRLLAEMREAGEGEVLKVLNRFPQRQREVQGTDFADDSSSEESD